MKTVHKSVLIWFNPAEMYALVTDVAAYPEFLPWCDHALVLESSEAGMTTEIGISLGGIRQSFSTRNTHVPNQQVTMHLIKGPFSRLDGVWHFSALGDGTQRACKVELTLNYGFDHTALGGLVKPVFDKIANGMVDAFVRRAGQVYGN